MRATTGEFRGLVRRHKAPYFVAGTLGTLQGCCDAIPLQDDQEHEQVRSCFQGVMGKRFDPISVDRSLLQPLT